MRSFLRLSTLAVAALAASATARAEDAPLKSTLPDKPIPFVKDAQMPRRPAPIVEFGDPFLGTGKVREGIEIPTGTVWNPSLYLYGDVRTALAASRGQTGATRSEWASRADIFADLHITDSERVLLQVEPIHKGNQYSEYNFKGGDTGWNGQNQFYVKSLFFEGESAQLVPSLAGTPLDVGVAVGRQNISFQDDFLVSDYLDAVGISKPTIHIPGASNMRATALFGWNHIQRGGNNQNQPRSKIYGLFTETDLPKSTVEVDAVYVQGENDPILGYSGSGVFGGIGATQRFGYWNTTFRALTSYALDDRGRDVNTGTLLVGQFATHPTSPLGNLNDTLYVNTFWGINNYTSAASDETMGGPLNRIGMLFTSPQLGSYGTPLNNYATRAYGGTVGYQWFLDGISTQLTTEVGARATTEPVTDVDTGIAVRLAQKLANQVWGRIDGYGTHYEATDRYGFGIRTELIYQF